MTCRIGFPPQKKPCCSMGLKNTTTYPWEFCLLSFSRAMQNKTWWILSIFACWASSSFRDGMKTFRIVIGILAILSLTLLVDKIFLHPYLYGEGSLGELFYPTIGIPILTLNFWAWTHPEIIEFYFLGHEGKEKKPQ